VKAETINALINSAVAGGGAWQCMSHVGNWHNDQVLQSRAWKVGPIILIRPQKSCSHTMYK
jgi:hypothetical protein